MSVYSKNVTITPLRLSKGKPQKAATCENCGSPIHSWRKNVLCRPCQASVNGSIHHRLQQARTRSIQLRRQGRSPYEELYYCKSHEWLFHEDVRTGEKGRLLCPYCFRTVKVRAIKKGKWATLNAQKR